MPRTQEPTARDTTVPIGLAVSAGGALHLAPAAVLAADERLPRALATSLARAFRVDLATGLLHLASKELRTELNPSLAFGRELGKLYLTALRARGAAAGEQPISPATAGLSSLLDSLPPLAGAEYATVETLADAWRAMDAVVSAELAEFDGTVHEYLQARNPAWHAVGRVTFHLAEQKHDAQAPFAFLATYAEGVAASGRVRHLPLGKALSVYSADREQLLRLLRPVHAAAERNPFVKSLADSGELYEPLAWTPAEAHAFLLAIPDCEAAG
ncbi:MAG: ATP-dependent helicase, partial [Planctomycetota bacterium]